MPSGQNNMYNKLDGQLIIIKYLVDTNKQNNDENKKKLYKNESEFTDTKTLIKHIMVQNQNDLPDKMDSFKAQDPGTVVPA